MSDIAQFWTAIKGHLDDAVSRMRPARVQAIAQSGGLLTVQRYENTTPDGEQYARLVGFVTNAGDEVICLNLDGTLLPLGTIQRAAPSGYALDAPLSVLPPTGTTTLVLQNQSTNTGIELGKGTAAETPYVDFHSSGNNIDYDARILASGGTGSNGQGTLAITAGLVTLNGLNWVADGWTLLAQAAAAAGTNPTNATSSRVSSISYAITLPAGTWTVQLIGGGVMYNDTATTGNVALWLTNNSTIATATSGSMPYTWVTGTDAASFFASGTLTGLTGAQTFFTAFANNGTGTAHLIDPQIWMFGKRTA